MPSVLDMEVQNDSCSSTGICLSLYLSFTATISHTFPFLRQNSIPYYWLLSINSPSHSFLCNQCMDPIGPTLDSVNSPTKLFQVAIIVSWFRSDQMFLGFTLKCVLKWRRCHHGVYLRFGIWKSADANFSWVQLSPPLSSGSCFFLCSGQRNKMLLWRHLLDFNKISLFCPLGHPHVCDLKSPGQPFEGCEHQPVRE